jgi:hypothetical protein
LPLHALGGLDLLGVAGADVVHVELADLADDIAPGWPKTGMPSRYTTSVGIDVTPYSCASSVSASVSTLANVASACFSLAFSKTGANWRHGGHHVAQKSMRTMPSPTVASWVSRVIVTVATATHSNVV